MFFDFRFRSDSNPRRHSVTHVSLRHHTHHHPVSRLCYSVARVRLGTPASLRHSLHHTTPPQSSPNPGWPCPSWNVICIKFDFKFSHVIIKSLSMVSAINFTQCGIFNRHTPSCTDTHRHSPSLTDGLHVRLCRLRHMVTPNSVTPVTPNTVTPHVSVFVFVFVIVFTRWRQVVPIKHRIH